MKTVVIIPTYNEAANIGALLDALEEYDVDVLVVDDNSPDGTADIVRKRRSKQVHLLTGEKKGLGVAYRRGMIHAMEALNADAIMEMDADFSHDPDDVPRMLSALRDADMVIGSRYVPGGSIEGWKSYRLLNSWGGNLVARTVAGIRGVRDMTAGFRAIRTSALKKIDLDALPAKGYGFQIALLHQLMRSGASVIEIPVIFRDRTEGKSKLGLTDQLEFFVLALMLGWQTYGRLLRFLIVGATGIAVNLGVLYGLSLILGFPLRGLGTEQQVAWLAALEVSILWNFFWHDHWTFKDRREGLMVLRAMKYHLASGAGIIVNVAIGWSLVNNGLHLILADLIAIASSTVLNFLLSYFWAWRKEKR